MKAAGRSEGPQQQPVEAVWGLGGCLIYSKDTIAQGGGAERLCGFFEPLSQVVLLTGGSRGKARGRCRVELVQVYAGCPRKSTESHRGASCFPLFGGWEQNLLFRDQKKNPSSKAYCWFLLWKWSYGFFSLQRLAADGCLLLMDRTGALFPQRLCAELPKRILALLYVLL